MQHPLGVFPNAGKAAEVTDSDARDLCLKVSCLGFYPAKLCRDLANPWRDPGCVPLEFGIEAVLALHLKPVFAERGDRCCEFG
jgi:hypothetical protein